ncbi:hypothetical protein [Paenibacillus puerhi]|uniref:hypothetical protein n=1 Tax=Paenibacillus puerhi TaxID=2692622 RepID=UPI00135BE33A|nr:hypothetical protein [Paenibacillus puerhi]
MKFSYDLDSVGWANVHLKINEKEEYFSPSYVTEPLIDLLDAVMTLMKEFTPDDEVKSLTSFEWDFEPAIVDWKLKRLNDDELLVTIEIFRDGVKVLEGKRLGEQLLSEQCDLIEFIREIVSSLDLLITKYGLVGYRENWSGADFPIGRYLKLKHFVIHRQPINVDIANEGEWNEYRKTNTNLELEILNNLFKE